MQFTFIQLLCCLSFVLLNYLSNQDRTHHLVGTGSLMCYTTKLNRSKRWPSSYEHYKHGSAFVNYTCNELKFFATHLYTVSS